MTAWREGATSKHNPARDPPAPRSAYRARPLEPGRAAGAARHARPSPARDRGPGRHRPRRVDRQRRMADRPLRGREVRPVAAVGDGAGGPLPDLFNTELVRYTLYTGEPAFTGFMRTKPGSRFWAWTYTILYFLQNGWPGWAGATAGAVFFLWAGRSACAGDARTVHLIGVGAYLLCVLILLLGGRRIERTMEILNWMLVIGILGTLAVLCVIFAEPSPLRWRPRAGFAGLRHRHGRVPAAARRRRLVPDRRVRGLLGLRRRHQHHALELGARQGLRHGPGRGLHPRAAGRAHGPPGAHGQRRSSPTRRRSSAGAAGGASCAPTSGASSSPARCSGMALPAILYTALIPHGTELRGLAIASELARAMAERAGPGHRGAARPRQRVDPVQDAARHPGGHGPLADRHAVEREPGACAAGAAATCAPCTSACWPCVVAWGVVAIGLSQPIVLLQLAANVAGFVLALGSLHILRVNTTLLPPELRPPRAPGDAGRDVRVLRVLRVAVAQHLRVWETRWRALTSRRIVEWLRPCAMRFVAGAFFTYVTAIAGTNAIAADWPVWPTGCDGFEATQRPSVCASSRSTSARWRATPRPTARRPRRARRAARRLLRRLDHRQLGRGRLRRLLPRQALLQPRHRRPDDRTDAAALPRRRDRARPRPS